MTDSKALVDKLWNYCNVLRDDGLSYGDYVEQLTGALSAVDLALADGNVDGAREWAYNSLDGLPYIDPDRFMRNPQLLFNAIAGARPCSFPGCPWHSTGYSLAAAWCSERHHQALNGELDDERCATCATVTICPWWMPGESGIHHLCGPCWEKYKPENAGQLEIYEARS